MAQQLLNDLTQWVGDDLAASATGDLGTASADTRTNQRIVRRLVTPKGSYIFHPDDYGAGLPAMIGDTVDIPAITGEIRSQIRMEEGVAQSPEPRITVQPIQDGVSVGIAYTSSVTRRPVSLQFNVNK
jgi:phage baseplate assembly protein W